MECDMGIDWLLHVATRQGRPRPLLEDVVWQGQHYQELIDSGSSITMVWAALVPEGLPLVQLANIT